MKTILTKFLAISSVALLMLTSCKKNDALITANTNKAGSLATNTTTPVISKANLSDTTAIITFSFTASQYGLNLPETNILQIDSVGDNWKNPASFTLPAKAVSQGFSTAAFDAMLLKVALPNVTTKVNVRVQHELSSSTNTYSNVISLTVTPINLTQWLYVPGDYEGWGNPGAQEDSLISTTGNGIYTGIVDFTGYKGSTGSLQYKLVPVKGSWTNSYGTFDSGTNTTIVYNGTNDGNLWVPTAAKYLITVNTNTNKISAVLADYYSLIGSTTPGTAWNTDTPLKYINDGTGTWSITGVAMTQGLAPNNGFKIRQDDAWTYSWGTLATPDGVTLTDNSGVNIGVATAGNYNVTFVMPATPLGTTPAVTTTYTLKLQ